MATYPDLPDNRLIVGGVDLSEEFRLILVDGYTLSPPTPKTYTVDVPGADGSIDLTESLTGDIVYENRKQQFNFYLIEPENFEKTKTLVSNFLHGKAFDYRMTMDPEYTYHGRFTVDSYSHQASPYLAVIKISIEAEPYKLKERRIYKLNACGGKKYQFISGRKPVRPIVETTQATKVTWNGIQIQLGVGSFRLNKVLFKEGINELYINSYEIFDTRWNYLMAGGSHEMTWNEAKTMTWDELQRIEISGNVVAMSWDDLSDRAWNSLTQSGITWNELDYKPDSGDCYVYLQYDWKDL